VLRLFESEKMMILSKMIGEINIIASENLSNEASDGRIFDP
jgi:hypothetical protein